MDFAICMVSAAPVRKEPAHRSEMVNQLLFGETMQVLEQKDEWFHIRSTDDQYEGWLTYHLIQPYSPQMEGARMVTSNLASQVKYAGRMFYVSMGSALTGFNTETKKLWDVHYTFEGPYHDQLSPASARNLYETAQQWLHVPYLWGGKTFMGVDCSGFVQTVFKVNGMQLMRDAWQQAQQGTALTGLPVAQLGDVAFFHNEKGRVTHVGIVLEGGKIIHASGKVRVDNLDEKGIMNVETGKRTHELHSLRRMT